MLNLEKLCSLPCEVVASWATDGELKAVTPSWRCVCARSQTYCTLNTW